MQVGTKGAFRADDVPSPSLKPPLVERPGVFVRGYCNGRGHWTALVTDPTAPLLVRSMVKRSCSTSFVLMKLSFLQNLPIDS